MNPDIFRQYDIRGIADQDLNDELVEDIGRAIATYAKVHFDKLLTAVAIGHDMRLSSLRLRNALTRGFNKAGVNVLHLGLVPTAAVYFASYHLDVGAVVQITGSHNPAEYNGFKTMIGHDTLHGDDITALRTIIEKKEFLKVNKQKGIVKEYPRIIQDYLDWIGKNIKLGKRKLKVVVDCGNGAGGVCAEDLVKKTLKQKAIMLYTEPDGNFPNHHPDPTVPENLKDLTEAVITHKADLGVAYDGDADRIGICDEKGEIMFGDTLLILLSRAVLKDHPGGTIIGEVKCSQKLFDDIRKHTGVPLMSRVGHSLIKAKLKETSAKLAGEVSGHIFFNDRFFGFDDGLYTTARLIEILSRTNKTVSELLADVPKTYVTPEIRIDCPEDKKFEVPGIVAKYYALEGCETNTLDGVRINFGNGEWALCRASNTQAVLVLRVEANSKVKRDTLLKRLKETVARAVESLN